MANADHVSILYRGVAEWNAWRRANPSEEPDLSSALLRGANLPGVDLTSTDLTRAALAGSNLTGAQLTNANLSFADLREAVLASAYLPGANLTGTNLQDAKLAEAILTSANLDRTQLTGSDLRRAVLDGAELDTTNLTGAHLGGADLSWASLYQTVLSGADLTGTNLLGAQLIETILDGSILRGARVYGTSVWDIEGVPNDQTDLVITPPGHAIVTVDDLKVAQFIYLLLSNPNLRDVINTITSKVVLILGRFIEGRKVILDSLREALREHNLTPVLVDFDLPTDRDTTETVTLLARMARFVVADITDPASIPMELQAIAPDVAVPIRAIVQENHEPFGMMRDLTRKYHWVLEPYRYRDLDSLLANLAEEIIYPAEAKRQELTRT